MTSATATKPKPTVDVIESKVLVAMLKDALLFAATDDMRPVLNAVQFEATPKKLTVVATDSYTLIERTLLWSRPNCKWTAMISRPHVELIVKAIGQSKVFNPDLRVDDQSMFVGLGPMKLEVPMVAGKYPDWRKLSDTDAGAGKNEKFALNPTYLARVGKLSIIKGLGYPSLVVTGQGSTKPVILETEGTKVILMPVRLSS